MSEKNPGYPFFAAPFQTLGILRIAPLFYGGLGCLGLFFGGRRWLGKWGGSVVGGAVLLVGRGTRVRLESRHADVHRRVSRRRRTGALLWAMLATDATELRRTFVGLLGFVALEGAVFIRYTNAVVLFVAVAAALAARRAARLSLRPAAWWLGSVGLLAGLVATFDARYYGGVTKTAYSAGQISFGRAAVLPNIENMPAHLLRSMPLLLLAGIATGWIALRAARTSRSRIDPVARTS